MPLDLELFQLVPAKTAYEHDAEDISKEWDFSRYHVKLFKYENCGKTFKAYYEKGKLSYSLFLIWLWFLRMR